MNFRNNNFVVSIFVLIAFLAIGVFGLLPFTHRSHTTEVPMMNCPYAENGYAICESNFDHINNWQQFSNVTLSALFVLFLVFALIWFFNYDFFNREKYFYQRRYYLDNKNLYLYEEIITKWLSLFENSPSLSYVRHS
ncbi:MAG: hypothetical protein WD963_01915 [Candidatus Paceibacterota bacterium]